MKAKKISIITLAILVIGVSIGGTAYKMHVKSAAKQELEIQHIKENENKEQQTRVQQVDKEKGKNNNSDNVPKKTENKDINKPRQIKKEKESNLDFESKVASYITKFKKSGDDIITLIESLDSINTNNLNETEKLQLTNLKLAARDWCSLKGCYDNVRQTVTPDNDPILDETLEYAREALNCNTKNLIDTGIMSKESVDKKVSLIREYIEKAKKYKEDEKKKKEKEIAQINSIKKKTIQERTEYYYKRIKDAKDAQHQYINSFDDPMIRQSLQTSQSAAFVEATWLEMRFPEDTNIIEENLKKVLEGK